MIIKLYRDEIRDPRTGTELYPNLGLKDRRTRFLEICLSPSSNFTGLRIRIRSQNIFVCDLGSTLDRPHQKMDHTRQNNQTGDDVTLFISDDG